MALPKITPEMKEILGEEYGLHKGTNAEFFKYIKANFDGFENVTVNQMRGILVSRNIYRATNPRTEPKKGGRNKADFIAELEELVGAELPSATKMTIADMETLIRRLADLGAV